MRCRCTLLTGFDVVLSPDGGEHTQNRSLQATSECENVQGHRDSQTNELWVKGRWGRTAKEWLWRFLAETGTSLAKSDDTS